MRVLDQLNRTRKFVFIVTYGRSGSTLLQSILASIEGAHITGENNDVLSGLMQAFESAVQTKRDYGTYPRTAPGDPWRGAHRINTTRFARKLADAFVDEVLRAPSTATLIGFKEIRYFGRTDLEQYLDFLGCTFTPALFVFNRRRAEDVVRSADGLGWWTDRVGDIAQQLREFDNSVDGYALAHPNCCVTVSYEDYVADAEALRPVFERLDEPFDVQRIRSIMSVKLEH